MRKILLIIFSIIAIFAGIKFMPLFLKYSPFIYQVLFHKNIELKETKDEINILLLGIGGGVHDGPNLTDTIMVSNIDQKKNNVTFISIPRDLWIPEIKGKINTAYAIGESKQKSGGLILAKSIVSKIVNKRIDYVVRVDFDGFIKAVDYIGGLNIDVERGFDDYQYPVEENREELCGNTIEEASVKIATMEATIVFPCRYEHVTFNKGVQHMNGERSLIFVRSRYAKGVEGTDFARSMRQQKVIKAFRDRIFSIETLLNPVAVVNLFNTLSESIDTDIKQAEFDDFIRLGQKMKKASIQSIIVDYGDPEKNKQGLLINPPLIDYNGAWVLIPREGEGNYSEIHNYIQCILTSDKLCAVE